MSKATVKISSDGLGRGKVFVDGVDMSSTLNAVSVGLAAGDGATITLSLCVPRLESLDLSAADVVIGGVVMPASVEMALYEHLIAKHGAPEFDATTLVSTSNEYGLRAA